MAKSNINKIIEESKSDGVVDYKKTDLIANELNRKSLKQYIRILKQYEKSKKISVELPNKLSDEYVNKIHELFPDKKVEIIINPKLILGLKITSGDDVLELNLKHQLDRLIESINNEELNLNEDTKLSESEIIKNLEQRLSSYTSQIQYKYENIGFVEKFNDGVITAGGLSKVTMGEIVTIRTINPQANNEEILKGVVLNLTEESVSIILLDASQNVKEGDKIFRSEQLLSIEVSNEILGRIIDPLGNPLDGQKKIKKDKLMPIERIAAGVVERDPVNTPLKTGIKAIDTMTPIGRGQRELIIGDRGLGKTAIAIDTIINQGQYNQKTKSKSQTNAPKRVICIYVAIGQKQSSLAQTIEILREKYALQYSIIVASTANTPSAMQYLAPYSACAIAEYFMEKGEDVLIVYDDLTKHAWAYRQLSLVLQRPAGREAYPGDIFYLHSRLLERSVKLNKKSGGGSITALPIIETQASDISAYIPTNVISITDGQIYLESSLFNMGIRPAINPGNSVSRVGGAAQTKAIKSVSGKLRLELAQYNSLAAFAQFGSELDESTLKQLERGKRIVEILKQPQYAPLMEAFEILSIWAVTNGYLDDIPIDKISEFEKGLHDYILKDDQLLTELNNEEKLSDKTTNKLKELLEEYKKGFK